MVALRMIRDEDPAPYDGQSRQTQAGFAIIPKAIRSLRDPYAKAVYMTLAFHADSERKCFPSRQTIAEESGCSIRKVDSVLADLQSAGFITLETSEKAIRRPRWIYLTRNPQELPTRERTDMQDVHIKDEKPVKSHGQEGRSPESDVHTVPVDVQEVRVDVHHVPNDVHTVHPNKNQLTRTTNENQEQEEKQSPDVGFEEFWATYPKHVEKKLAVDQWKRIKPSPELQSEIMTAIVAQKTTRKWQEGYIKAPHRWLRDRNWEDEIDGLTASKTKNTNHLGLASW
ncbi:MAG: helix-turn-helix domain-containing protein [Thermomicrobiales bacterium]